MEDKKVLNIYQRLLAITNDMEKVAKNLTIELNAKNKYSAVGEVDVLNAVKPLEVKYGVYSYPVERKVIESKELTTKYDSINQFMRVETIYRFVNVDKPDEFIDVMTYGDGVDSQDKAPGKAMTYADKYALLKAYKIATGDDPDKDKSEEHKTNKPIKATEEQISRLQELFTPDRIVKMLEYAKVKTLEDLSITQASDFIKKEESKK